MASALGGEVSGQQVLCPGPGHSPKDRSLSVKLDPHAPDGFVVFSHSGDDAIACRDPVRVKAGLPAFKPKGNGHRPTPAQRAMVAAPVDRAAAKARLKAALDAHEAKGPAPGRIVATYPYVDADGALLYEVLRYDPKDFKQRRPDGRGGWIYNGVFEGVRRVPYRLQELAADLAAYPDAPVFVCEGEKDTDNVRALGLFATCAAGGVWTDDIVAALKGRDIVYLADNDEKGREKAIAAGHALTGVAASIRIAGFDDLPEKGDVSDWVAFDPTRHNADALIDRCRNAPIFDPDTAVTPPAPVDDQDELGAWGAGDDAGPIPPRGWLLGNAFCRRFISSLLGEGGAGKSALRMAQLLSLATGRSLTREHVFLRCRVLIVSLEDDADELRRRLRAACLHHGIGQADLKGWLFLAAPGAAGGKILSLDPHGRPIRGKLAAKLARTIKDRRIDVVSIDPFVKAHSVEENNNSMVDEVVQVLADLAIETDIAVDLPHHVAKGASDPGNANRGRGASAMKDAARLVYTLTPMSVEEGKALALSEAERRLLVRLDSAKVNIAPPWHEAKWFRLVGVDIGNATDLYPNGDQVQTIEPWTPPDTFAGMNNQQINRILDDIQAGLQDGNRFTDAPKAAVERAAWRAIARHCDGKPEAVCRHIIRIWLESGLLTKRNYDNPNTRKPVSGLWVDDTKRPT